jgi:hypothetical protein
MKIIKLSLMLSVMFLHLTSHANEDIVFNNDDGNINLSEEYQQAFFFGMHRRTSRTTDGYSGNAEANKFVQKFGVYLRYLAEKELPVVFKIGPVIANRLDLPELLVRAALGTLNGTQQSGDLDTLTELVKVAAQKLMKEAK